MRRISITLRLTLFFATASTAVLIAVGTLVGASVETHFEEQDLAEINGKLELVRHALGKVSASADLDALPRQLDDALVGHPGLSVAVVAPGDRMLFATAGADFPRSLIGGRSAQSSAERPRPVIWESREHAYRGIAATVPTGLTGTAPFSVAVAVQIDHHRKFMAAFRTTLWASIAFGILLTGLLGWFAARRGLAPVRDIAEVAKRISASRLDDRLPLAAVPEELVDLADSFNGMLARLEHSFRRLSDFSSDLTHELRTPVSNLMTRTQVALSKSRSTEEYREVLYSNLEEYDRLARMIADMLFLAKADNGLVVPSREDVDLTKEVDELIEFYEALAEAQGVGVVRRGAGTIGGDRLMLRRAISNLLSNAIRHTPRGGSIKIEIANRAEGGVRIAVENAGEGIAQEHLPRLFDRFYRVDPSRQRNSEGAGLGLAITKSIIVAHGGTISASSAQSMTRFEIDLGRGTAAEPIRSPKEGQAS